MTGVEMKQQGFTTLGPVVSSERPSGPPHRAIEGEVVAHVEQSVYGTERTASFQQ